MKRFRRRFALVALPLLAGCAGDAATTALPTEISAASSAKPPAKSHPTGTILGRVATTTPWGVAVRDDGLTYLTSLFTNSVGITRTTTRTVSGSIPTGALPTGIAFSPDGTRAYTANQGDNTVSVIDAASSSVVGTIVIGTASPFSVEVSPDGTQLFVGNNDNTLSVVNTQTGQVTRTVQVGFATNAFTVSPDGKLLYASHFVSGTVSEIDIASGAVQRTFFVGGVPQGLALNKKGTRLFVANEWGYLTEVTLATGATGANIPLSGPAFGVGVAPDDHEAWITVPTAGVVQVYNLTARRIVGVLDVGGNPRRVAFSELGKIGAVTDFDGAIVFVK